MKQRCHEFGGVKADGGPCGRVVSDGPCLYHTDAALGEQAETKAAFLAAYKTTLVKTAAAHEAKTSVVNIWRWRRDDDEFDAELTQLEEAANDSRYEAYEESMYARIVAGTAPAALHIFGLVNESRRRRDGRWKHVHHVQKSNVNFNIEEASDDELERLIAGEDPFDILASRAAETASGFDA